MPENLLLSNLMPDLRDQLDQKLETVSFDLKTYVMRVGEPIEYAYFPATGLISIVVNLEDGGTVETLTTSNEGFCGISLLLNELIASRDGFVQVAGEFRRLPTDDFLEVLGTDSLFRSSLQKYASYALRVIEQTAACLAFHPVEARLARWLLSVEDRLPGDLLLTHEFLGQMLGVYRPTVTLAIGMLQDAGLISSRRGVIRIDDRDLLEKAACECYRATRFWPRTEGIPF